MRSSQRTPWPIERAKCSLEEPSNSRDAVSVHDANSLDADASVGADSRRSTTQDARQLRIGPGTS